MRKGVLSYWTSSIILGMPPNHWVFQEIEWPSADNFCSMASVFRNTIWKCGEKG